MTDIYDGPWRLFSHDVATGRTVWVLHHDGGMTLRTDYPVQNIISANHELAADTAGRPFGDWARVASVPLNVFHEQLAEPLRQKDDRYLSKFLNDSDNRAWRTKEGKI